EHLSGATVLVFAHGHIAFAVRNAERKGARAAPAWEALSYGPDDHVCTVLLGVESLLELRDPSGQLTVVRLCFRSWRRRVAGRLPLCGGKRLGHLAIIAVDRDRLQPEPP